MWEVVIKEEHYDDDNDDSNDPLNITREKIKAITNNTITIKEEPGSKSKTQKLFECNQCNFTCFAKKNFQVHLKSHSEDKPVTSMAKKSFSCDDCVFKTMVASELKLHQRNNHVSCKFCEFVSHKTATVDHMKIVHFTCEQCGHQASCYSTYMKHQVKHSLLRRFVCPRCEKSFKTKKTLMSHETSEHADNLQFACGTCEAKFRRKKDLEQHSLSHLDDPHFSCSECDFVCKTKMAWKLHILQHDVKNPFKFQCSHCEIVVKDLKDIENHMPFHLPGFSAFKYQRFLSCSFCEYKSKRVDKLKRHSVTSHSEFTSEDFVSKILYMTDDEVKSLAPGCHDKCKFNMKFVVLKHFHCDRCNFASKEEDSVTIHKMSHNDEENPFHCKDCEAKFNTDKLLIRHMKTHKNKEYICDQCDYSTYDSYYLKCHQIIHSNDRPYECKLCDYKAKVPKQLGSHMKMKHSK